MSTSCGGAGSGPQDGESTQDMVNKMELSVEDVKAMKEVEMKHLGKGVSGESIFDQKWQV